MTPTIPTPPRFRLGQVVMGQSVTDLIERGSLNIQSYLERHVRGDWGDISQAHVIVNEVALHSNDFVFSRYNLTTDQRLWIITDGDRHTTTVLLVRRFQYC